jgi:hypothetical protein
MSDDRRRILKMVADGQITVDEAERLLTALGEGPAAASAPATGGKLPRYLRVVVEGDERVNIRIPVALLRAGMKLGALLPEEARGKVGDALEEKGVSLDLGRMKPEDVDQLLRHLSDLEIDVDGGRETVRVYCE